MVDFTINMVGMDQLLGAGAGFVDLRWDDNVPGQERAVKNENNYSTINYKFVGDDVDKLSERPASDSGRVCAPA
jgi:YidC/Oxa1 family membrane protein insertase